MGVRTRIGCASLALVACSCTGASVNGRGATGTIDPGAKYVVYLHGRILQARQQRRPHHPRFGPYEHDEILAAFRGRGFVVISDLRPADVGVEDYGKKVARDVQRLLDAGVPARRITVVGASMGGVIALVTATQLRQDEVNFAILAGCAPDALTYLRERGRGLAGHLLSIRESSDEMAGSCRGLADLPRSERLSIDDELVLDTGLGHGFLYRPLPEWMGPLVAWANERGQ